MCQWLYLQFLFFTTLRKFSLTWDENTAFICKFSSFSLFFLLHKLNVQLGVKATQNKMKDTLKHEKTSSKSSLQKPIQCHSLGTKTYLYSTPLEHTATNIFTNKDTLAEDSEQERACAVKANSCTLSQVILGKASWKR